MVYTIGRTEVYEKYLREDPNPTKLGQDLTYFTPDFPKGYPGGSVWKTYEEAQKYCPDGFSVYGILADWEKDTATCIFYKPSGNERNLIPNAKIIKIVAGNVE